MKQLTNWKWKSYEVPYWWQLRTCDSLPIKYAECQLGPSKMNTLKNNWLTSWCRMLSAHQGNNSALEGSNSLSIGLFICITKQIRHQKYKYRLQIIQLTSCQVRKWPEWLLIKLHLCFKTSNLQPIKTVTISGIQLSEAYVKKLAFYQVKHIKWSR